MDQLIALVLGLHGSWVAQLTSFALLSLLIEFSSTSLVAHTIQPKQRAGPVILLSGPQIQVQAQAFTEASVAARPSATGLHRAMVPDMALGSSPYPDISMTPGGSTGHPNQAWPQLWHDPLTQGLRWPPRPWSCTWPSVTTEALKINSDPGCRRAMDPDVTLCSSPSAADNIAPSDGAGYSDQGVPRDSMFLGALLATSFCPHPGYLCGAWWQRGPQTLTQEPSTALLPLIKTWPLIITQVQTSPWTQVASWSIT